MIHQYTHKCIWKFSCYIKNCFLNSHYFGRRWLLLVIAATSCFMVNNLFHLVINDNNDCLIDVPYIYLPVFLGALEHFLSFSLFLIHIHYIGHMSTHVRIRQHIYFIINNEQFGTLIMPDIVSTIAKKYKYTSIYADCTLKYHHICSICFDKK